MKTILILILCGGWSFGQEDAAAEALAINERVAGVAEDAMAMVRDERLIAFVASVRALEVQAIAFANGMFLIGGDRLDESAVQDYWTQSAACLAREVELRAVWKVLTSSGMTQTQRDEIGAAWVKMSKVNDVLSKVLDPALDLLPDSARVAWQARAQAKAGPRTREPVIVK